MASNIENKLSEAGYHLFGEDKSIEKLIIDILDTNNERYLKSIPFLIYKHNLKLNIIHIKSKNKEIIEEIIYFTNKLFSKLNINKNLTLKGKNYNKFNYKEFEEEFILQYENEKKKTLLIDSQKYDEERNLMFNLSKIFTKKEREIILKIFNNKELNKTEYEYFSRKTKKKAQSIIYLEQIAKNIINKKIQKSYK